MSSHPGVSALDRCGPALLRPIVLLRCTSPTSFSASFSTSPASFSASFSGVRLRRSSPPTFSGRSMPRPGSLPETVFTRNPASYLCLFGSHRGNV